LCPGWADAACSDCDPVFVITVVYQTR
jgi:hypothetical protein